MRRLLLLLALLPQPVFANFDCVLTQSCASGECETFSGASLSLRETGDIWEVFLLWESAVGAQRWEGYSTSTRDDVGVVSIVIPPLDGKSGLISVYPTGEAAFTIHETVEAAMVAVTATGNCSGEGG